MRIWNNIRRNVQQPQAICLFKQYIQFSTLSALLGSIMRRFLDKMLKKRMVYPNPPVLKMPAFSSQTGICKGVRLTLLSKRFVFVEKL